MTYTFARFDTVNLPTGFTGPDLSTLFNVTGNFTGTPVITLTHPSTYYELTATFVPVPEPASVLGVAAAVLGGAGWVRRRRAARPAV